MNWSQSPIQSAHSLQLAEDGVMPARVQRKRSKGWRMPENTVYVGRPTRWGNPFAVGDIVHKGPDFSGRDVLVRDSEHACNLYREWLFNKRSARELIFGLQGKNLACWCPLDQPCHADVLLRIANAGEVS